MTEVLFRRDHICMFAEQIFLSSLTRPNGGIIPTEAINLAEKFYEIAEITNHCEVKPI